MKKQRFVLIPIIIVGAVTLLAFNPYTVTNSDLSESISVPAVDNDIKLVSYEYTKECSNCGGIIEGYYSLVDYTRIEWCTNGECGYHSEEIIIQ